MPWASTDYISLPAKTLMSAVVPTAMNRPSMSPAFAVDAQSIER
jgi:hypothetical protein